MLADFQKQTTHLFSFLTLEVAIDEFVHSTIHTIKCSIVKEETNILVLCR